MAFKMKNPSVAKMVKMAGNNRTAMKMKAEEAAAMKMKKAAMKLKEEAAMKMKKEAAMKLKEGKGSKKVDMASPALNQVSGFPEYDGKGKGKAPKDLKSPAKLRKPKRKKDGPKAIDKARKKVGDTSRPKGSATKMKKDDSSMKMKKGEAMKMKKSAMKLEGNPKKEMTQAEKDAAIANAMPSAKKETLSKETMAGMKSYFGGVNADISAVKEKIADLKAKTLRTGASKSAQAKFDADLKEARRIAKARYPQQFR